MARLIAKSPCDGMLPAEIGGTVLSEVWPEAITLIAPFKGKKGVVVTALKAQSGCAFPAPNRATGKGLTGFSRPRKKTCWRAPARRLSGLAR